MAGLAQAPGRSSKNMLVTQKILWVTNTGSQSQSRPGVPRLDRGHGQITKTYAVHQQAIRILLSYPQTCRWMTAIDRDDRQRGSRPVQAYCTDPHRTMTKCINNDEDRHIFLALETVTKMTWSHAAAYGKKTFQTVSENTISDNEMFTALVDTSKVWDCPGNLSCPSGHRGCSKSKSLNHGPRQHNPQQHHNNHTPQAPPTGHTQPSYEQAASQRPTLDMITGTHAAQTLDAVHSNNHLILRLQATMPTMHSHNNRLTNCVT